MRRLTFSDGHQITTMLSTDEVLKRMSMLDWLRVATEGYEDGIGVNIYKKALRAYDKTDNFTGVIRLNTLERDFLDYMYNEGMLHPKEKEAIKYFLRY